MIINLQLTEADLDAIADKIVARLKKKDGELLDIYQAAKLLGVKSDNPRSISSRMSKLSNPRYTRNPLPVHSNGGRLRFYKEDEINEFKARDKRN